MPKNITADNSELGTDDTCHHKLTSPNPLDMKKHSRYEMRSRADTDDDDESDSHSDDDSPFTPDNEDPVSGKFDASQSVENSKITLSLQSMSLEPKTSSSSAGSCMSREACARSSSESSHPITSDEEDYSEEELTPEDLNSENEDNDRNPLADIMNTFKQLELKENLKKLETNNKGPKNGTSQDKNCANTKTGCILNIPNTSKNEKDSVSCEDDSDDEDTEFRARGVMPKKDNKKNSKPYDRQSTSEVDAQEECSVEAIYNQHWKKLNPVISEFYREGSSTNGSPIHQSNIWYPSIDASSGEGSSTDASPTYPQAVCSNLLPNTTQVYSFPAFPVGSPQMSSYSMVSQPSLSPPSAYLSDGNEHSLSPIPPDLDLDCFSMPLENDSLGFPTGLGSTYLAVPQPLSSSSSPLSEYSFNNSPVDYGAAIDPTTENIIASRLEILNPSAELPIDPVTNLLPIGNFQSQQGIEDENSRIEFPLADISELQNPFATTQNKHLQNKNIIHQASEITNTVQSLTAGGTVTVTPTLQVQPQNIITLSHNSVDTWSLNNESNNNNVGEIRNSTPNANYPMSSVPNFQPPMLSASAPNALIPITVENPFKKPSPPRNRSPKTSSVSKFQPQMLRTINPWPLLEQPSKPATERLRQNIDPESMQETLVRMYGWMQDKYTEQRNGHTRLMNILCDAERVRSELAKILAMLEKMALIPNSLILRDDSMINGYDALYLAAMECPEFDYVTGALVAAIATSPVNNKIWHRKYGIKGDTLIHAVAAKGETHIAVLRELLTTRVFDLSALNGENKTPLHVAVEAHDPTTGINSVATVRMLMEFGAKSTIKNNSGDTALHTAMSKTHCLGLVQALLCNDNGREAINICNNAGNTPLHLAALLLNSAPPSTQETVCSLLIVNGGRTNIANLQNKMPLGLVAENRREIIRKILHKKS